MPITEDLRKHILIFQQTEITEYHIYKRPAKRINSPENAKILDQIAEDELRPARFIGMACLRLGVAAFSFIIGYFICKWLGVDI